MILINGLWNQTLYVLPCAKHHGKRAGERRRGLNAWVKNAPYVCHDAVAQHTVTLIECDQLSDFGNHWVHRAHVIHICKNQGLLRTETARDDVPCIQVSKTVRLLQR